ncbi:MAG: hypothetical protein JXB85_04325 [Anaerolineales bacterium]|nr:hypothetical protein [Anaerolineales bacterium]
MHETYICQRSLSSFVGLLFLLLAGCASVAMPEAPAATPVAPTATFVFPTLPPCTVAFVESDAKFCRCWTGVTSPSGRYRFYADCIETCPPYTGQPVVSGIFVSDMLSQRNYRLDSECFLPNRPVVRQAWISDEVIAFIISSNPHYGWYFEVDVFRQEMTTSHPVSDAPGAGSYPIP